MIGEARPKADVGPSYYYLCRKCNYGFTTAVVNSGRSLTMQERRLAGIDSKKIIEMHKDLFPLPGVPQVHEELDLFPKNIKQMFKVKTVEPGPSTDDVLEKSRSLLGTVGKMEVQQRAEDKRMFDERTKPIIKIVKEMNAKRRREEARARPHPARYGKNGRPESAGTPRKQNV
jgi:hypothetical protein